MARRDGLLLAVGLGAGYLLLSGRGKASADTPADEEGWSEWDDAEEIDTTPDVPPPEPPKKPRKKVLGPQPIDTSKPRPVIDVTPPPLTADQIRQRYKRQPTDAELLERAEFERQVEELEESLREQDGESKAPAPAGTEGAVIAAKKAAAATTTSPQTEARRATGNALSSALRTLHPVSKAKAQGTPTRPSPGAVRKVAAPAGTNISLARSTAQDVAKHLRNKGKRYNHAVVKQWQQRAGMKADGIYGPATASALRYYGANAPAPLFKGVDAKYVPPT